FVAQPAHPSEAGVEIGALAGLLRQRVPGAVVGANAVAKRSVRTGAAELLDPGVLVRRHGLAGELPTYPIVLFGDDHRPAAPQGRQCRCDSPDTPSDDQDVCTQVRVITQLICSRASSNVTSTAPSRS